MSSLLYSNKLSSISFFHGDRSMLFQQINRQRISTKVICSRFQQPLALSNGLIEWSYRMALSYGPIIWSYHMVLSNGLIQWSYRMVLSNGSIKWSYQMVLSNGFSFNYSILIMSLISAYLPLKVLHYQGLLKRILSNPGQKDPPKAGSPLYRK